MTVKRHIPRGVRMGAERLLQLADTLTWYMQPGGPLPPLVLSDDDRWEIADKLRALARNERALLALETARPVRKLKPGPKVGARNWWAALELDQVRKQPMDGNGRLPGRQDESTAAAWGLSRTRLREVYKELSERTPANQRLGGWRYWACHELKKFRYVLRKRSCGVSWRDIADKLYMGEANVMALFEPYCSHKHRQQRAAFIKYLRSQRRPA